MTATTTPTYYLQKNNEIQETKLPMFLQEEKNWQLLQFERSS